MTKKIQNIINHYVRWRNANPDSWIQYTNNQDDLISAIRVASMSENHLGKRNNHQRRLKMKDLKYFTENLMKKEAEIRTSGKFEKLLTIVESCKVKGNGELTCYDVANRIGCKIGVYPKKVYLHAGTKKGAERLLGFKIRKKHIEKLDLPDPLRDSSLTCAEIEDILCIYKEKF